MKKTLLAVLTAILILCSASCSDGTGTAAVSAGATLPQTDAATDETNGADETARTQNTSGTQEETGDDTAPAVMPDLVGANAESAKTALAALGIPALVEYEYSDSVEEEKVIRTSPEAGSEISGTGEDASVTLFVSKGPEPTQTPETTVPATTVPATTKAPTPKNVSVPDLAGFDEKSAKKRLTDLGLTPAVEYEHSQTVPNGRVIRSDPRAKKSVPEKSTVTLKVSSGPDTFFVKDANIIWTDLKEGAPDKWSLDQIAIFGDLLLIHCAVDPGTDFVLKDPNGAVFSLTDSFENSASLALSDDLFGSFPEYKQFVAGEETGFFMLVPLSGLGSSGPEKLFFRIPVSVDGENSNLEISFEMTW